MSSSIPFVPFGAPINKARICPLIQVIDSPPAANDPDRGEAAPAKPITVTPFKPRIIR